MAEVTQIHHEHECPVKGCHKRWHCLNPECACWKFKNCEAHAAAAEAPKPSLEDQAVAHVVSHGYTQEAAKAIVATYGAKEILADKQMEDEESAKDKEPPSGEPKPPEAPQAPVDPQAPPTPAPVNPAAQAVKGQGAVPPEKPAGE